MLRIGFVLPSGFQAMSLAALSAFELANVTAGDKIYDIRLLSEEGGPLPSSLGVKIDTQAFTGEVFDTLIVGGLLGPGTSSPRLRELLRVALPQSRRMA